MLVLAPIHVPVCAGEMGSVSCKSDEVRLHASLVGGGTVDSLAIRSLTVAVLCRNGSASGVRSC